MSFPAIMTAVVAPCPILPFMTAIFTFGPPSKPPCCGPSWEVTIGNRRRDLTDHLADNPGLKTRLPEAVDSAYERAVDSAYAETGLPHSAFPAHCPWSFDQIMDAGFWPDSGSKS